MDEQGSRENQKAFNMLTGGSIVKREQCKESEGIWMNEKSSLESQKAFNGLKKGSIENQKAFC